MLALAVMAGMLRVKLPVLGVVGPVRVSVPAPPEPWNCRLPVKAEAVPRINLPLVVSAVSSELPPAFWIWKAVVESTEFLDRTVPVNLLLPVKVWGPVPFSSATLEDSLASFKVPEDTLEAFRLVRLEPSPVKELEALEKVLAPVKVWVALSLARLESLDRLAEEIWVPLILYTAP